MGKQVLVLLGTKKGAFFLASDGERRQWTLRGPFCGVPIRDVKYDPATGAIYAAGAQVLGETEFVPGVWKTTDFGETWTHSGEGFSYGDGEPKIDKVWHLMPAHGALYAGVEPAGLFRSDDGGETWQHIKGLREHPTCPNWQPGAAGLCLHSIVPHPTDPDRMWVAMSSVGTFYTADGGATWEVRNRGLRADFPIDQSTHIGYCVHKLVRAPGEADILYQQHHGGVFRSLDGGSNWADVSAGLPCDFGFGCAAHPHDPSSFYVIPIQDNGRFMPEGKAGVYRATQYGDRWTRLHQGLPQEHAYFQLLREGMAVDVLDPHGIYFGTNNGFVWASNDQGETWSAIASHLPYVWSVSTAVIEE